MKRAIVALAFVAACGGKSAAPATPAPATTPAPVANTAPQPVPESDPKPLLLPDDDTAAPLVALESIKTDACACTTAQCADHIQSEFEAWAKKYADTKGTQSQADRAGKLAGDISECMVKAMGKSDDAGLADCDEYLVTVDEFVRCDKVPQSVKDATQQGAEAIKDSLASEASMSDDQRKATNDACKQATAALKQGADAMGCSL